ncbi:hypothetical protein E4U21_003895 [Claviceps maximensis]|nr:hypothetical protein E4U21_003895 [Claviceps maximensis]
MLRLVDETEALRRRGAEAVAMEAGAQRPRGRRGGGDDGDRDGGDGSGGARHGVVNSHGDADADANTDQPRLLYYGTSYGTVLGNTFLSMFPGRVKRMILDGVIIADDWVRGNWDESVADTHLAIDYFYQTCFRAGAKCALRTGSDTSWHAVRHRVDALVARLDADPVPGATVDGPEVVIDGSDVLGLIFGQLYSPLDFFESLARTLAEAVGGNYTRLLAELVPPMSDGDSDGGDNDDGDKHTHEQRDADRDRDRDRAAAAILRSYTWSAETFSSVACGDTHDLGHYPLSHWQQKLQKLQARYPRLGVLIADQTIKCAGWQSHPRDRFAGPFRSPAPGPDSAPNNSASDADHHDSGPGRPSAPLLLLSNLYDPITPLDSARFVARSHPASRVLVQNSVGHCTLLSSPSKCTRRVMQAYMANGTMPDEGLVCEGDCVPFEKCPFQRGRFRR